MLQQSLQHFRSVYAAEIGQLSCASFVPALKPHQFRYLPSARPHLLISFMLQNDRSIDCSKEFRGRT